MPKKSTRQPKPLYRQKKPKIKGDDFVHAEPIVPAHFELREDGTIDVAKRDEKRAPVLTFRDDTRNLWLYQGNSLELLDAIAAKHPEGRFDCIFADPPYFLSNGGISCHAGRMVKVDKGDWDKSRGAEVNHEFNLEWLKRCQKVLKPNGTIWITGTHHVIFSIGYAMQQLGFKILNDIAWEKPNPPPNLSCRYFTHSTETILWAAKSEKSKHLFNYQEMRKVTGKQMKTVWRASEFGGRARHSVRADAGQPEDGAQGTDAPYLDPIWTMTAPGNGEKTFGKHPTQKPVALVERCILASTQPGDMVLDPFLGGGTTAVACVRLNRGCIGIELDFSHFTLAAKRADREIIELWLREFRVRFDVTIFFPNDLDLFSETINGSSATMDDKPQVPTESIYHECKFVFLSCAQVERGAVVHTTVDVSLQEAWAKTPNGKKRETTHVVRCETEIFRVAEKKPV
ncbi:MAG: site-specific DNA-methyltransferase [Verrucomicrobiales bacterium]|nr:site-specific DNA-methyltransferase [Verrucomicrobiales bacterium]